MSDDLDAILARHRTRKGPDCGIGKRIAGLSDEQIPTVLGWLDDDELNHSEIARTLTEVFGVRISPDTVGRHRRGDCTCADRSES